MGTKQTRKRVRLAIGKSEKEFSIALLSNQMFSEAEYTSLVDTLSSEKTALPSIRRVDEIYSKVEIAKNYVYKPEIIRQMVEYENKMKKVPSNITAFIIELKNKKEMLMTKNLEDEELCKIDKQVLIFLCCCIFLFD